MSPAMDRTDFRTMYRDHYGFVWSTVRRFGVPTASAEDVVQDTFVAAFRRRRDFDGRSPRAWLYRIGRHVASNHIRGRQRAERRHEQLCVQGQHGRTAPAEIAVGAQVLRRFLDSLTATDRELFVLSEVDGLTGPELADALQRKLATIYARVRTLRQRLLDFGDEPDMVAAVAEQRTQRPRATAAGWAIVLPRVELGGAAAKLGLAASVASWASTQAGVVVVATGLAATVLGTTTVVARALAEPRVTASTPNSVRAAAVGESSPLPPEVAPLASPPVSTIAPSASPTPTRFVTPAPADDPTRSRGTEQPRRRLPEHPRPQDPPQAASVADDLVSNTRLLNDAQTALRAGHPAEALAQLEEHIERFEASPQSDARAALQIVALCRLGRSEEAQRVARAVLSAHPDTPFADRIARSCVQPE